VPVHYDPMLAKVIAAAETRADAITRLASALRAFPILGIRTNIPFLLRILEHPRFRAGEIDTGFLDREGAELADVRDAEPPEFVREAIAFAAGQRPATGHQPPTTNIDPWGTLDAWGR